MRHRANVPAALVPFVVLALALGALVALGALLAACGTNTNTAAPSGGTGTTAPQTGGLATGAPGSGAPGTGIPSDETIVRAYFGLGSTGGNPILAPVERPIPAATDPTDTTAMARAALDALIAGPVEAELSASPAMFTSVPPETEVTSLQIANSVATVDLSEAFIESDDLPALRTAMGQVVVTLTQFPDITGVNVTIGGAVLEQTDADGKQLAGPATRADYADQLGPLFVDSPAWGASLQNPIRLVGLANVFEATFRFRLLDAAGRTLHEGQLKASCGTGCLGTYEVEVPFTVTESTQGRLQVFDLSEQDGSMQDVVDYPVTLLP